MVAIDGVHSEEESVPQVLVVPRVVLPHLVEQLLALDRLFLQPIDLRGQLINFNVQFVRDETFVFVLLHVHCLLNFRRDGGLSFLGQSTDLSVEIHRAICSLLEVENRVKRENVVLLLSLLRAVKAGGVGKLR